MGSIGVASDRTVSDMDQGISLTTDRLSFVPLVSLGLNGSSFTEHDDIAPGAALLGRPVWGPSALLANLELRLGLAPMRVSDAVRLQTWARKLESIPDSAHFYSRSYAIDRLGTASALLAMRDELVLAGWSGAAVPGGGDRLATFVELEEGLSLPPGDCDRLGAVESELASTHGRPLDAILLAEEIDAWPGRWRRVLGALAEKGVAVEHTPVASQPIEEDTDLARVQAALVGEPSARNGLKGDGSFVLLRGETSWEVASAVAAFLREQRTETALVLRGGDVSALDGALVAMGLRSQGLDSPSDWRPILQVLPLAIELAFEPRDPYRVLELITLPGGPFHGFVGGFLASAMERGPGVGGRPWVSAKERIATRLREQDGDQRVSEVTRRIEEWLERPGHPLHGAPRDELIVVGKRVTEWLRRKYAFARTEADANPAQHSLSVRAGLTGAAVTQAQAFCDALEQETREVLDIVDARLLVDQVRERHDLEVAVEEAGRIDVADAPSLVRASRDLVVWWHCVAGTEWRAYPRAWRLDELDALAAQGIVLPDTRARLRCEAGSWRSTIMAARRRLVLVAPRFAAGSELEPHPIVDEIVARLGLDRDDLSRVSVEVHDLLANAGKWPGLHPIPLTPVQPLILPPARAEWRVPSGAVARSTSYSATLIDEVLGCPLRSVLARSARLRAGSLGSIPRGDLLYGKLAHRLVEELHLAGAITAPADAFGALFDRLVREEASVLTRPGMTFELVQLRAQLERSALRLAELLTKERLSVIGVESHLSVAFRGGTLDGDLDLLVVDERGDEYVFDLKWGSTAHLARLKQGRAIQLAVYVHARHESTGAARVPHGAYFSLKQGRVLATEPLFASQRVVDGPSLDDTWAALGRTLDPLEAALARGTIPVTGVSRSLPLVSSLVADADTSAHLHMPRESGCPYCAFDAICGKRWESLS